jgi:hypothetical protein
MEFKMNRVVVTRHMIGICAMQVCAEHDVTDEEILKKIQVELHQDGAELLDMTKMIYVMQFLLFVKMIQTEDIL